MGRGLCGQRELYSSDGHGIRILIEHVRIIVRHAPVLDLNEGVETIPFALVHASLLSTDDDRKTVLISFRSVSSH